eukprot:TRINITY_DN57308_c0_g1_i1.p1 TRINITY_DN57308_c0_g1~~TRINITY_DN57308_c0_g1_i1.p1  ORF type:complete len:489 (+),score=77.42 TRINITY_DN57308_c0_g1_i1:147-1613(+)
MEDVSERSSLYRGYALFVLLLVGVSNLATRQLPSYLASVQVVGSFPEDPASGLGCIVTDASFYSIADGTCLRRWEFGVLIGYGFAFVFAIASVGAGVICDRTPRVALVSVALTLWSVGTSMQASAKSFCALLMCRSLVGFAQAFALPSTVSLIADYFKDSQHVAQVILSASFFFGSGCASFSIVLAQVLGWRWTVLLAGLAGIPVAALLRFTVAEPERTTWSAPCSVEVVASEIFGRSRVARRLIVAVSAKFLASVCLSSFLPIWYSRQALVGYSSSKYASLNALVVCIGGILSAVLGCILNHSWGRRDPRAPCWIGLCSSLGSLPLLWLTLRTEVFTTSLLGFLLLLIVGESWFDPSMILLQASVRRSVRGQAVTLLLVVSTLAANAGPALLGSFDSGGAEIGNHLFWIASLANVTAAAAFASTALEVAVEPVAVDSCSDMKRNTADFCPHGLYDACAFSGLGVVSATTRKQVSLVLPHASTPMGFY